MAGLQLTRRLYEEICIGDSIVVRVSEIRGNLVRLTVVAPPEIRVDRREIRDKIVREGLDRRDLRAGRLVRPEPVLPPEWPYGGGAFGATGDTP